MCCRPARSSRAGRAPSSPGRSACARPISAAPPHRQVTCMTRSLFAAGQDRGRHRRGHRHRPRHRAGVRRAPARRSAASISMRAAEATRDEVATSGRRAIAVACDVSLEADARPLPTAVAGGIRHGPYSGQCRCRTRSERQRARTALAAWDRVFAVNVSGAYLMSRAVLPSMIAAGGGSIIHIASQLGRVAAPRRAVYCASEGRAASSSPRRWRSTTPRGTSGSTRFRPARSRPIG